MSERDNFLYTETDVRYSEKNSELIQPGFLLETKNRYAGKKTVFYF